MLGVYLFVLSGIPFGLRCQLNMYDTESHLDRFCLILFHEDTNFIRKQQFIPHCLRLSEGNMPVINYSVADIEPGLTFVQLKEKNITSDMLLSWSSTIELAEQYEIFLTTNMISLSKTSSIFYNCTSGWFGPLCRFNFYYIASHSFEEIVQAGFKAKRELSPKTEVTCYKHSSCETFLSCLDWREICDGNINCIDAADEEDCWQLEINQCNQEEYRCHNGQCIPIEFLRDDEFFPDCIDRTDEIVVTSPYISCYKTPSFQCEETMCPSRRFEFPCGDGDCTDGIATCFNGRSGIIRNSFCSNATACLLQSSPINANFCRRCQITNCIKTNCSPLFELDSIPPIFGHIRLMFSNTIKSVLDFNSPSYVCYNESLCEHVSTTNKIGHLTCRHFNISEIGDGISYDNLYGKIWNVKQFFRSCLPVNHRFYPCDSSSMYQCRNSKKCISIQRLLDDFIDCPENDDETYNRSCSLSDVHHRFQCRSEPTNKCFSLVVSQNQIQNCVTGEDELDDNERRKYEHIYFQNICDGVVDLYPIFIDGHYETDETNCKYWSCNNTYTRCNRVRNCKNAIDEMNCSHSSGSLFPDPCFMIYGAFKNRSCISINRTNEQPIYRVDRLSNAFEHLSCSNAEMSLSSVSHCFCASTCPVRDSRPFCSLWLNVTNPLCTYLSDAEIAVSKAFNCSTIYSNNIAPEVYFKLENMVTYPLQLTESHTSDQSMHDYEETSSLKTPVLSYTSKEAWRCHRGVLVLIRVQINQTDFYCLCPPSYYGDLCQYQNERVSITVQVRAYADFTASFLLFIRLMDQEKTIESNEYIQYVPSRHCDTKFNLNLLYSRRPKISSNNYSVQIDVFDHSTLSYRAGWFFPLKFAFLPVYRLSVLLKLPMPTDEASERQCFPSCLHGQCVAYMNHPNVTQCLCDSGWSGIQCNIQHRCSCAPRSLCMSDSICLCPSDRFGRRCHLIRSSCLSQPCLHGGQCVLEDIRSVSQRRHPFTCRCLQGYNGSRCQYRQNQVEIDLSFDNLETVPPSVFIHLIAARDDGPPKRLSFGRRIRFDEDSLKIFTGMYFNMAFVQIFPHDYYLIIIREQPISLQQISTKLHSLYRCRAIMELFDERFAHQHLLKRIKYYHIPCEQHLDLYCFYDDVHLCLCTRYRQANCFEFDHNVTYDCHGVNPCKNQGQCFVDDDQCPTFTSCACPNCYFGSKCQYSTKGSTLSLDIILGYHIRLNNKLTEQKFIIKIALVLTAVIFVLGSINSLLLYQTFKLKPTRNTGCSLYLHTSSFVSMVTVIILTLKLSFLLSFHLGSIRHRSIFHIQCLSIDFLLRCLLAINDWLNTFVAVERAINVCQGVNFSQTRSKNVAKPLILINILLVGVTFIYDPLHRHLMDEVDEHEQHIWCLSMHSPMMQKIDLIVNCFHFLLPFLIKFVSTLIIIFLVTRIRSKSQQKKSYKQHLREQFQQHKHLLISPSLLVGLAIPRLIISLLSGCMKSARDSWFYLMGYFVSFAPSIMTFAIFILPSDLYKDQFRKSMTKFCQ